MTKVTVVTDVTGHIIAAVVGHSLVSRNDEVTAEVGFDAGHKLHKIEVEDDITKVTEPHVLEEKLRKHLSRA